MRRKLVAAGAVVGILISGAVQAEREPGSIADVGAASTAEAWPGFFRSEIPTAGQVSRHRIESRDGRETELLPHFFQRVRNQPDARRAATSNATAVEVESVAWESTAELSSALAAEAGGRRRGLGSLRVAAGYYDIIAGDDPAVSFSAEYHLGRTVWWLDPFAGVMLTTEGAAYAYAGLALDIVIADRVSIAPSAAIGAYHDGGGKDLGHWVEFRTGAELAYIFDNQMRLGAAFYHISNAGLGKHNPGTEILELTYSTPLGALLPR